MSCQSCKSECGREDGCGERKSVQKVLLDQYIARLYPSRTWGQPDDEAAFRAGLAPAEVLRLATSLGLALKAKTTYRPGGPDDLCSYIYVLCLGREPALIDVRDQGLEMLAASCELAPGETLTLSERYLRVACSSVGRMAAVQEVAMELELGGDHAPEGMAVVREVPRPGVFDPKLLKRFQKTTDLLLAHGIEHLDMGLLDLPAETYGLSPGEYADRYGTGPGLINFFFYAEPAQTAAAVYLPLAVAQAPARAIA